MDGTSTGSSSSSSSNSSSGGSGSGGSSGSGGGDGSSCGSGFGGTSVLAVLAGALQQECGVAVEDLEERFLSHLLGTVPSAAAAAAAAPTAVADGGGQGHAQADEALTTRDSSSAGVGLVPHADMQRAGQGGLSRPEGTTAGSRKGREEREGGQDRESRLRGPFPIWSRNAIGWPYSGTLSTGAGLAPDQPSSAASQQGQGCAGLGSRGREGRLEGCMRGGGRGERQMGGEQGVQVSFLMLYFEQPENLRQHLVTSLTRCVACMPESDETALDLSVELLVNADKPDDHALWLQHWQRLTHSPPPQTQMRDASRWVEGARGVRKRHTSAGEGGGGGGRDGRKGRGMNNMTRLGGPLVDGAAASAPFNFLTVVFAHNSHENRAYNALARAAHGDVLVLLQDDDMAPLNCSWLQRIVVQFDLHRQMGAVGYNGARRMWTDRDGILPDMEDQFAQVDKATGDRSVCAQLVDVGPMAVHATAWRALGGFDEALSHRGETGILADWQLSMRLWLAGYWVASLFTHGDLEKQAGPGQATSHSMASNSFAFRQLNEYVNYPHVQHFFQNTFVHTRREVWRCSQRLVPLEPF